MEQETPLPPTRVPRPVAIFPCRSFACSLVALFLLAYSRSIFVFYFCFPSSPCRPSLNPLFFLPTCPFCVRSDRSSRCRTPVPSPVSSSLPSFLRYILSRCFLRFSSFVSLRTSPPCAPVGEAGHLLPILPSLWRQHSLWRHFTVSLIRLSLSHAPPLPPLPPLPPPPARRDPFF
jgi:hypothetical protein